MDISALAQAVTSLVLPVLPSLLKKVGESAAGEAGKKALGAAGGDPGGVEDAGEDGVADFQVGPLGAGAGGGHAGQAQRDLHRVLADGGEGLAAAQAAVERQHGGAEGAAALAQEVALRVGQVGLEDAAAAAVAEEELLDQGLDAGEGGGQALGAGVLVAESLAELLGHVGVAGGPGVDGVEEGVGVGAGLAQAGGHQGDLVAGEVAELDGAADIERRAGLVGDEVAGQGDARQRQAVSV